MKRSLGLLGGALLLLPAQGNAQSFDTASAEVTVFILAPVVEGTVDDLEGELVAGEVSGEVVVDPAPGQAAAGRGPAAPRPLRPASYHVAGRRSAAFALVLPEAGECTLTAPGASIPVKGFKVSVAGGPATGAPAGLTFNAKGMNDFKVGATLLVGNGLPGNRYVGHFTMTMAYN